VSSACKRTLTHAQSRHAQNTDADKSPLRDLVAQKKVFFKATSILLLNILSRLEARPHVTSWRLCRSSTWGGNLRLCPCQVLLVAAAFSLALALLSAYFPPPKPSPWPPALEVYNINMSFQRKQKKTIFFEFMTVYVCDGCPCAGCVKSFCWLKFLLLPWLAVSP
jgi:hypothetical protein